MKRLVFAGGLESLPALTDALSDPRIDIQIEAVKGLGGLRLEEAVPALLGYLRGCDLAAVEAVAQAFANSRQREAPAGLMELLSHPDHTRRYAAAICLGTVGDRGALEDLARAARDRTGMVRRAACRALGELGDRRAALTLTLAAEDSDPLVRREAARGLGKVKAGGKALQRLVRDPDWKVRREGLRALSRVGDEEVIPTLEEALGDVEDQVREVACELLAGLGEVEPVVQTLANDPRSGVRRRAAQALGRSGDARAADPLLDSLAREGLELRAYVLAALRDIMGAGLEEFLANALGAPEARIRRAATNALATLGARRYASEIAMLLDDPDPDVRYAAVHALGELRASDTLAVLRRVLEQPDTHAGLRSAAAHAISKIPGGGPILEQAAHHPSPTVREEALAALSSQVLPDGE